MTVESLGDMPSNASSGEHDLGLLPRYLFAFYRSGQSVQSDLAIAGLRSLCDETLPGR
ncbi:MAG: hypothetical protein FJY97_12095 [candidate division Zixibacteria bacterium]|nr:hypothetical protein [candidate division Zixibacteria bacterium]